MSAVVCGKRSSSIFEELLHTTPPPSSKRIRCCSARASSHSPTAVSPSFHSPSFDPISNSNNISINISIDHLRSLFPGMDPQLLERALEASGNDLDAAIRSLNDLQLESVEGNSLSSAIESNTGMGTNIQLTRGVMVGNSEDAFSENPSADILPLEGSEWVELLVREMMNATDVDDARGRASRVLELLEKTIAANTGAEAVQTLHKENSVLKEQVEVLLRENTILKRAVAIQHERQKEYDERSQELQNLKLMVAQYQEQLRTLEVNNYALTVHLKQAQQSSSIPGRFHPDVF